MEGPGNLLQPHHSGGGHWLEPAERGGGRSLGESEEGGKKDEGGVCVRRGGIYVQKAAKWQLTLLNINHLCFCNFGNASRPTTAEYFINITHFQLHFSHFSFSHPCPPTPSPPIASASHGHDIHPLTDILGSPALSTCSIHSPPIMVSMRGKSGRSGEGRSSTPTGGKYKCASTSPVLNNT